MEIRPLDGRILVIELERGERSYRGIVLRDDNGTSAGIRPRWAKVYKIGANVTGIQPGQWVLIEHGRWTRTIKIKDENGDDFELWGIDPKCLLMVTDEKPNLEIFSEYS